MLDLTCKKGKNGREKAKRSRKVKIWRKKADTILAHIFPL